MQPLRSAFLSPLGDQTLAWWPPVRCRPCHLPSLPGLPPEPASRSYTPEPPRQPASRIILLSPPTSRTDLPPGPACLRADSPNLLSLRSYPRPLIISLVMATLRHSDFMWSSPHRRAGAGTQSICSSHSKSSSSDKFPALSIVTISPGSLPCLGAEPWAPPQMAKPEPGFPQAKSCKLSSLANPGHLKQ